MRFVDKVEKADEEGATKESEDGKCFKVAIHEHFFTVSLIDKEDDSSKGDNQEGSKSFESCVMITRGFHNIYLLRRVFICLSSLFFFDFFQLRFFAL